MCEEIKKRRNAIEQEDTLQQQGVFRIRETDNVAVALTALTSGHKISLGGEVLEILQDIPAGHKVALHAIPRGEAVIKYGYSIGKATVPIRKGEWVHTHNLKTGLGELLQYEYKPGSLGSTMENRETKPTAKDLEGNFLGYRRPDGSVGIRNEIWIIPTVGCVNDIARQLEREGRKYLMDGVDQVSAFPHPYGCSQLGEDQENTQKILTGLIRHPNAAGVLVLGLGCENNSVEAMKNQLGEYDPDRVKFLICQDWEDELEQGLELLRGLMQYGALFRKEKIEAGRLIVGLKCGGSDGFSGITANPVVGGFSDLLIAQGGTTILTEVPEMFGAETILMNRCADKEIFQETVSLINDFKQYFMNHDQSVYENPSPGNKKGGISTLEDKSLGCTQKSGAAIVTGVLSYGETVRNSKLHPVDQQPGNLQLLSSPGNDLVASTALAAAGAHIILFTTGRGTPFGSPVPTLKISSNSDLAKRKSNWIDFDAGRLLSGKTQEELAGELYRQVLDIAGGLPVRSEENGYRDIAIFKQGITL